MEAEAPSCVPEPPSRTRQRERRLRAGGGCWPRCCLRWPVPLRLPGRLAGGVCRWLVSSAECTRGRRLPGAPMGLVPLSTRNSPHLRFRGEGSGRAAGADWVPRPLGNSPGHLVGSGWTCFSSRRVFEILGPGPPCSRPVLLPPPFIWATAARVSGPCASWGGILGFPHARPQAVPRPVPLGSHWLPPRLMWGWTTAACDRDSSVPAWGPECSCPGD